MKKFLVILMVLAMASVLFVGCTTPPTPDPDPDPDPTPTPIVSATPVLTDVQTSVGVSIITVTSTSTQYMNIADVGASILVTGTAPSESLVKIYLDDVAVGPAVAEASTSGLWSVAIAKSSLGDDGVKVLTAKVTEVGLAEGVASNAATFTLDTVRPSATTLVATANTAAVAMVITSEVTAGVAVVDGTGFIASDLGTGTIAAGTWTVRTVAVSGTTSNVEISDGTTAVLYTVVTEAWFDGNIPGVEFTFVAAGLNSVGSITTLTITDTAAVVDRATVLFSEEITNASATTAANYVFTVAAAVVTPGAGVGAYYSKLAYFNTFAAALVENTTLRVIVDDVVDLAGNAQTTESNLTCTIGAAHLTTLAP